MVKLINTSAVEDTDIAVQQMVSELNGSKNVETVKPTPKDYELLEEFSKETPIKAEYKIEIQFGKDRSISALKPSTGVLVVWESGKKFHGGGDQLMVWCGYDNCSNIISASTFGPFSVVCPRCMRENFLNEDYKKMHIDDLKRRGLPYNTFRVIPCIYDTKIFKLSPVKIAELIEKVWRTLDCNADIYLKYHPLDIRFNLNRPDGGIYENIEKARKSRGLHIYPLENILKDTSAGANVHKRFLAFITA